MKTVLILLIAILSTSLSFGQTTNDSLIGMVDQQLIKINKNNGGISAPQAINGISAGVNPFRLTWCEPNQCFYALSTSYPPVLSKIDANGNFITIGTLTYPQGTLYMCEGLGFNRADGELYASASLNGNPNSVPADYYSEVLVRIDTNTLTTTLIGTFNTSVPTTSEADCITFDDNGMLYLYDGQPGQLSHFFMQDLSFTNAPILMHSEPYEPVADLTVKNDVLYFSKDRALRQIDIPTLTYSTVGTLFTPTDFNGEFVRGITWRTDCPPMDLLGNDTTLCSGQALTLSPSISGNSYLWQDGSTNTTFDVSSSGTYWVEVNTGACSYSDTIDVTIEAMPSVNLGNDTTLCIGETLLLQGSTSNGSYAWQDGSTNADFTVSQAGTYWLSFTNVCGTASDTIVVNYSSGIPVDLGPDSSICSGSSIVLQAPVADAYLWQDGSTNESFVVTVPGLYIVEVTDNGCTTSDAINITQGDLSNIDLGPDQVLCIGQTTLLDVDDTDASFTWNTGSSEPSIITNGDGIYWVQVTNDCGTASDSVLIESEECFCEMYIPNTFTPNDDEFNSDFGPEIDCPIFDYVFEIYNRWGEIIFSSNDPYERWNATYKGQNVQDGMYSYKVRYSTDDRIGEIHVGHVNVIR